MIKSCKILLLSMVAGVGLTVAAGTVFGVWSSEFARRHRHDELDPRIYLQGLTYAWGRDHQRCESEGPGPHPDSVEFAKAWAEACITGKPPSIKIGFENFRDHGLIFGLAEETAVAAL